MGIGSQQSPTNSANTAARLIPRTRRGNDFALAHARPNIKLRLGPRFITLNGRVQAAVKYGKPPHPIRLTTAQRSVFTTAGNGHIRRMPSANIAARTSNLGGGAQRISGSAFARMNACLRHQRTESQKRALIAVQSLQCGPEGLTALVQQSAGISIFCATAITLGAEELLIRARGCSAALIEAGIRPNTKANTG